MNKITLFSSILFLTLLLPFSIDSAFTHPHSGQVLINSHTHESQTKIIPLTGMIGIEKSTIFFHSSEDNILPWAYIEGKIANHVKVIP